jgi:hypothetical protein
MVLIDDDTEGVGFFILPDIENKNGTLSLKSVYGKVLGLNCLKAILIDIVFENEEKMTIKNEYNKFNCDGDYSISLSKKNLQQLKSNTISKIRFLNYSDGKMVTITKMSDSNKTFLKDVLENIEKVNNGLEIKEYVEN